KSHLPPRGARRYTPHPKSEDCVDFFTFDKAYVERLREGDPSTEEHFVGYFEQLLRIKLRSRMLTPDKVEDLRQETFIRVIAVVRKDGVRQPERFGAFVNSICNNVLLEHYRSSAKSQPLEDAHMDMPDKMLDLDGMLVTKQSAERVRRTLDGMPKRDRDLLRGIFLEDTAQEVAVAFWHSIECASHSLRGLLGNEHAVQVQHFVRHIHVRVFQRLTLGGRPVMLQ